MPEPTEPNVCQNGSAEPTRTDPNRRVGLSLMVINGLKFLVFRDKSKNNKNGSHSHTIVWLHLKVWLMATSVSCIVVVDSARDYQLGKKAARVLNETATSTLKLGVWT